MFIFIVNPTAGEGRARYIFSLIQQMEQYRMMADKKVYFTDYPTHAEVITREILHEYKEKLKGLFIIGGDGTIHEVINGLDNVLIPISFIPSGSGNDFAKGINLGNDVQQFLKPEAFNKPNDYWFSIYKTNGFTRKMVNSLGFGFDAEIAERANSAKSKRYFNNLGIGKIIYLVSLVKVLRTYKPKRIQISIDGITRRLNDCWMLSVGNHPYYGGGLKILPHAKNNRDKIYGIIIHALPKWKVLLLFLSVIFGWHRYFKEVELFEADTVEILSDTLLCYQVDGQTDYSASCKIEKEKNPISVIMK
ncbi:diacylglycerol/lipid kinase family protein [Oceanobacillus sp. 1P07AA]|uniref:diacylglycerol/lipid kinase family protein n=1 Tax=Oceanobacillus sp. 1P07AA TaxID=3132293 RepID=UPI0039A57142